MLGLIISSAMLFSSPKVEHQIIWESLTPKNVFSFKGYTKLMINPAFLSEKIEASVVASLNKKGTIVFITDINPSAFEAIAQSQIAFHILKAQTSDPEITLVEFFATTPQKDKINGSLYSSKVWEKLYIIHRTDESDEEIQKIVDQTVDQFLAEFQDRDLVFYFPDPLKKFAPSGQKK